MSFSRASFDSRSYFPPVWFAPADEEVVLPRKKRGGMSFNEVLSATLAYRRQHPVAAPEIPAVLPAPRKKKRRRSKRRRETELLLFGF